MNQNELRDLLLSLAAEASIQYEKVLFDRNTKFDEIKLITRKLDDMKEENKDSVFSPRSNLSAYDARVSLEKQCEKEKEELSKLDCQCDSFLNRKEELLEAVELLDSIIEEREEYYKELQTINQKDLESDEEEKKEVETEKETSEKNISEGALEFAEKASDESVSEKEPEVKKSSDDEVVLEPTAKQLKDALSFVAYQCGEIADYTVRDPYRARNELRSICVKWGN